MEEETKKQRPQLRVSLLLGTLMIVVALIYDGGQNLIELASVGLLGWVLNPLISLWSFMTFWTWFKLKGVSYSKPSKFVTVGAAYFIEILPFLNDIPAITLSVIILLSITYAEDILAKISPEVAVALSKILSNYKQNLATTGTATAKL